MGERGLTAAPTDSKKLNPNGTWDAFFPRLPRKLECTLIWQMDFANAAHLKTSAVNKSAGVLINSRTAPARDLAYTDSESSGGAGQDRHARESAYISQNQVQPGYQVCRNAGVRIFFGGGLVVLPQEILKGTMEYFRQPCSNFSLVTLNKFRRVYSMNTLLF